ncbi:MAG: LysR family transcriptional regulator [Planctomycetes bacterium]|nr:LysR family transcriptional regulator [Planctomycetota bacterium]MCC7170407.1 LysR family transcriptional regulator [Planctomycetota bacterium]
MRAITSIEMRHLRTFLAVAETENFTRAAERLGISQPSISQQIKELETALSTALFVRHGPRVRLTDVGRSFRERAALVAGKFAEACRIVSDAETLKFGHLDVGVIPALAAPWIPQALEHMGRTYPGVVVSVHERSSSDIETEVESGRYEVGVGILSRTSPRLRYERLREDRMCLVVSKTHALATQKSVPLKALADERVALMSPSFLWRHMTDEALRRANVRARIAYELETIDTLLRTTFRCNTATLVPSVVLDGREDLDLVAIPVSSWTPRLELGLIWLKSARPAPAPRAFAELIRKHVGNPRPTSRTAGS